MGVERASEAFPKSVQTIARGCLSYVQPQDQPIDAYSNL